MKAKTIIARSKSLRASVKLVAGCVLAVVGVLGYLVMGNVSIDRVSSKVINAQLFVQTALKAGMEHYRSDMGDFPKNPGFLLQSPPGDEKANWAGPYLSVPNNKMYLDPWGERYRYRYPGVHNPSSYDLWSTGPDGISGTADDIGNW